MSSAPKSRAAVPPGDSEDASTIAVRAPESSATAAARPAASPSATRRETLSNTYSTQAGSTVGRTARMIFCAGVGCGRS